MFLSQKDVRPRTDPRPFISQPLPPKQSDQDYHWLIVFHWDIGNENPFSVQLKSIFSPSEVPESWYLFKLRDDLRMKKQQIRFLNGSYSVFCKVEKGKRFFAGKNFNIRRKNKQKKNVFSSWWGS